MARRLCAALFTAAATLLLAAAAHAQVARPEQEAIRKAADLHPEDEGRLYDPYEGLDQDGRIPSVEKPVENPGRWRYIPEGRIKPGNIFQRFLVTSFVVPIVFRDGDAGTGGGLGLTDIDFRQQRRREFAGIFLAYTTKKQQTYWMVWRRWLHHLDLPEGGVLQEERSFARVTGGFQKTLSRRFFGFGPRSDDDDEIKYRDELISLDAGFDLSIPHPGDDLVLSLGLRAEHRELGPDDFRCGGSNPPIGQDELGRPCHIPTYDRDTAFRQFIEDSDREQVGWLTTGLRYDTRDSQRNPYTGWSLGLLTESALLQDDNEVGARFTFSGSKVFAVPGIFHSGAVGNEENPPTDTLAFGAFTQFKAGDLPFTALPTLGGSNTLRGFIDGRYRDDAAWHAGVEHRIWVIPRGFPITDSIRVERVGFAPFAEVGTVDRNFAKVVTARVHWSAGVGLRILLERAAPFRVDVGFSDEGVNWTARFGYTF